MLRAHHAATAASPLRRWLATAAAARPTALVAVADGSEEIETACITDVLVRAGVDVTLATVKPADHADGMTVTCSRGLKLVADATTDALYDSGAVFDALVLPGGMPGADALFESKSLRAMIFRQHMQGGSVSAAHGGKAGVLGAICAAPARVLARQGVLKAAEATCYPEAELRELLAQGAAAVDEAAAVVVFEERIVTSQGPATALQFGVELVRLLVGEEKAEEVADGLLLPRSGRRRVSVK